MAGGN
ncbi:hypothetical protein VCHC67A1_02401A, partial [Vibrio cholerae HC-67A1]